MGYLRLYTYGGKTAAELKAKASIPSQADITVGADYIDCASVDIPSEIRDIIGEGSNDLGTIYCSSKVNRWSNFCPYNMLRGNDGLVYFSLKSNPYDMSNFCGYNHNAYPPSWFYSKGQISFSIAKNESNQFSIGGFYLSRGDTPPVSRGGYPCTWTYTMLKVVITDTTNNRTLTGYSAVQSVPTSTLTSPYFVTFTDDLGGGAFSGTATITLVYTDSTGTDENGYGEDVYPEVALQVSTAQAVPLLAADFNVQLATTRWYYVKNNVSPYNELVYSGYQHFAHSSYTNYQAELVTAFTYDPVGMRVPPVYPAQTWPLAVAVIFESGVYREYTITEYVADQKIISNRSVPATFPYAYKLTYQKNLSGWPTTSNDF